MPISMAGIRKNWLKSLYVMSSAKVFSRQDGWPASWTNMTDHMDPYDAHNGPKMTDRQETDIHFP